MQAISLEFQHISPGEDAHAKSQGALKTTANAIGQDQDALKIANVSIAGTVNRIIITITTLNKLNWLWQLHDFKSIDIFIFILISMSIWSVAIVLYYVKKNI